MSDNIKGNDVDSVSPDVLRSFGFYESDDDAPMSSPVKKDPRVAMEERMQELYAACQRQVDEAAERQDRDPFPRGTMVMAWGHDCDEDGACDVLIGTAEIIDGTRIVLSGVNLMSLRCGLDDVLRADEVDARNFVYTEKLGNRCKVPVIQISAERFAVVHAPKNLVIAINTFAKIYAEESEAKKAA